MRETDITVVGAGPAGMSSAAEAAQAGAKVTIIDNNLQPGGQYFKQLPSGFNGEIHFESQEDVVEYKRLLHSLSSKNVTRLSDNAVFSVDSNQVLSVARKNSFFQLKTRKLILATGAYERPVPFPGWTLPGVFSAGAVQMLTKIQRVLPGRRILVVGSGPLLYPIASMLVDEGVEVVAVVEAATLWDEWRKIPNLLKNYKILFRGFKYLNNLRKANVRIMTGSTILRAEGDEKVNKAVVVGLENDWRPVPGTEKSFDVDAICVHFGFTPSVELARLAGCETVYNVDLSGFMPTHDENMETTVPGVFVAGETAGIGGAGVAILQGRISGIMAAQQLNYSSSGTSDRLRNARKSLSGQDKFREAMNRIFAPRSGIWSLMQDDTIVCRCENLTSDDLRNAAEKHAFNLRELKNITRMGMGACQGRFCSDIALRIFSDVKGIEINKIPLLRARPPATLIPLSALTEEVDY